MNEYEYLKNLYLEQEYSIRQIAKKIGMSPSGTRGKLIRYNIPLRTDKQGMNTERNKQIRSKNALGDKNLQWTGKRTVVKNGYITIYMPEHPNNFNNKVYEHRLVMEKKIGRYLTSIEEVHHIDGDKHNNDPKNLQLFATKAEHTRHHMKKS